MKNQELFDYLSKEHSLNLLEHELEEIERIVLKNKDKIDIDKSFIGRRLRLLNISDELISKYLKHRKKGKQQDTEKSFNRLFSDIDLNVVDLSEVLELMIEMNWKSFSMDFVQGKKQFSSVFKKQEPQQEYPKRKLYI